MCFMRSFLAIKLGRNCIWIEMHFSSSKLQQPQQRHFSESCDLETLIKDLTLTPNVRSKLQQGRLHQYSAAVAWGIVQFFFSSSCAIFFYYMQQCNSNAPSFSFVRNFKLQLDYVSTSMFEKMHAAPALLALLRLTTFQFHLISKSTKISLTPLKNVCEKSLHMLENRSFYKLDFKRIRHDNETFLVIQHCAMKATYQVLKIIIKTNYVDRWCLVFLARVN